jgi:hypothetical protein
MLMDESIEEALDRAVALQRKTERASRFELACGAYHRAGNLGSGLAIQQACLASIYLQAQSGLAGLQDLTPDARFTPSPQPSPAIGSGGHAPRRPGWQWHQVCVFGAAVGPRPAPRASGGSDIICLWHRSRSSRPTRICATPKNSGKR